MSPPPPTRRPLAPSQSSETLRGSLWGCSRDHTLETLTSYYSSPHLPLSITISDLRLSIFPLTPFHTLLPVFPAGPVSFNSGKVGFHFPCPFPSLLSFPISISYLCVLSITLFLSLPLVHSALDGAINYFCLLIYNNKKSLFCL